MTKQEYIKRYIVGSLSNNDVINSGLPIEFLREVDAKFRYWVSPRGEIVEYHYSMAEYAIKEIEKTNVQVKPL